MKLDISRFKQNIIIDPFYLVRGRVSRNCLRGRWYDKTPKGDWHVFVYGEGPGYYTYEDTDPEGYFEREHGNYHKVEYSNEEIALDALSRRILELSDNVSADMEVIAIVEHAHNVYSFHKERITHTDFMVTIDDSYLAKAFEVALEHAKDTGLDELAEVLEEYLESVSI